MDQKDRDLLDKHAVAFSNVLDLNSILPILTESGLWRDSNEEELKVGLTK
jgi:hypothetical protein